MFNLLNKIIPRHCLFCLQKTLDNEDICEACFDAIAVNKSCCQRCASPIEQLDVQHNLLCGHCLSHQHDFDQVISPFLYSKEIRYLITSLKYQKKIHFAKVLAELFIQQVNNNSSFKLPQAIIPMPMHVKRLRDRGFNQALELSRYFSSYYALPLDYKSITRSRYTDLQAGLAASERQKNVANAFSLKKTINYQHIAIVDDVMTTGSSADEVAKLIKKEQNKDIKIDIWTIARAGMKH